MEMTTPAEFARRLQSLRLEMDRRDPPVGTVEDTDSVSGLILHTNSAKDTRFPSSNLNTVQVVGDPAEITGDKLRQVIRHFADAGIGRFFFWLDPVPGAESLAGLLLECGFEPFVGTTYPVLLRSAANVVSAPCDFVIRRLDPQKNAGIQGCFGDEIAQARFRETIGHPGFDHFAAFYEAQAVATARLFTQDGLSYLNDGGTHEEFRNRGAQSALIAARIARAAEIGSSHVIVKTLGMLETSLNNLRRAGFEILYHRVPYCLPG
jgi:GNAT superfamily N-acetyltransferase